MFWAIAAGAIDTRGFQFEQVLQDIQTLNEWALEGRLEVTATSLHAGHLVPLSVATRFARAGHQMIALVGGATGMVGDPSGRSAERQLLGDDALETNVHAVHDQIKRFVSADARMVNNKDWFAPITFLG